jgi:hypothetical protein
MEMKRVRLCVPSIVATSALWLTLGCSSSKGIRDAHADRVIGSGDDVSEGTPDLPTGADSDEGRRDSAVTGPVDAAAPAPGRDASESLLDATAGGNQDGLTPALPACSSYELVGPAKSMAQLASPAVHVGDRYAVLSTPSTKADTYSLVPHFFYDVVFSWFDPQTASLSGSVMPFRFRSYDGGGTPVDYGEAAPAAITSVPSGFAIAWTSYRESKTSLYFALLDDAGAVLSQPVMLDGQVDRVADVVWDGSQFAVAWIAWGGPLRLGRLDNQGNLIGTAEVAPQVYLGPSPRLFWDGNAYGLFWESLMPLFDEVWFARVDREGSLLVEPMQMTPPDRYAGSLLVEPITDGYLAYWDETPKSGTWFVQPALHKLDRNGQAAAAARPLDSQACGISAMARSGSEIGVICSNDNAVSFAGLGLYESPSLTPRLPIGLPKPEPYGIRVASAYALHGKEDGFDIFWTGSLDGATWGNYLTQIRCAFRSSSP